MRKSLSAVTAALTFASFAVTGLAAGSYTLFGDATEVGGGVIQLVSDADPGYGGVDVDIPAGLTFADLNTLTADYNVTDDNCAGGSPRFQINLDTNNDNVTDGNIFTYFGPEPSYNVCPPNTWLNDGNYVGGTRFLDTSQLPLGTFYDTYAAALAKYGSGTVLGVQLVVDSGWAFPDGEQTVLVRNIVVNDAVFVPPISKEECKNGGWMAFGYKNQGQCVSTVASKNK